MHPNRSKSLAVAAWQLLALAPLTACQEGLQPVAEPTVAAPAPINSCGRGGFVKAGVFGAVAASIDWDATTLTCEGMPRPDAQGARLRFAGQVAGIDQGMSVIIALPDLQPGRIGQELATNATLILEGEGRFFSTAADGVCWTDVIRQEPLSEDRYTIAGQMYCIAPLVEVNGDASVSIPKLDFSGLLDWDAS